MINKETLHRLVEELPDGELPTALRFLQYLKDTRDEEDVDDARDLYPYARASMRGDDEGVYGGDADLVGARQDAEDESVADAWRNYLTAKPRRSEFDL